MRPWLTICAVFAFPTGPVLYGGVVSVGHPFPKKPYPMSCQAEEALIGDVDSR